jgi:hypothetical protein
MKTRNFLPTLLALIIRVMVSGQTQGEFRTLPVLGGTKHQSSPNSGIAKKQSIKEKSEAVQKDLSSNPSSSQKVYPTVISSEEPVTKHPILVTENPVQITHKGDKNLKPAEQKSVGELKETTTKVDNNTFNYYSNSNCYSTATYANELLKQAGELSSIEMALRTEAKTKKGTEKIKMLEAANGIQKQSQLKQIQASEISGKLNLEKFNSNETAFKTLLFKTTDQDIIIEAQLLNSDAVYSIRLAKEMREEAYSITNTAAKLGTMNNAEEKEFNALNKQGQAINLLKQSSSTASKSTNVSNNMAAK